MCDAEASWYVFSYVEDKENMLQYKIYLNRHNYENRSFKNKN